jgi:hypothetical protein
MNSNKPQYMRLLYQLINLLLLLTFSISLTVCISCAYNGDKRPELFFLALGSITTALALSNKNRFPLNAQWDTYEPLFGEKGFDYYTYPFRLLAAISSWVLANIANIALFLLRYSGGFSFVWRSGVQPCD